MDSYARWPPLDSDREHGFTPEPNLMRTVTQQTAFATPNPVLARACARIGSEKHPRSQASWPGSGQPTGAGILAAAISGRAT